MINQNFNLFYASESLLGAAGIFPILRILFLLPSPNPIEAKSKWIFTCLFSLFLIRFPYQAYNNLISARLTYTAASLLVFAIFLYFEVLLRRHMPRAIKIFVAFFSLIFFIDTLCFNFFLEKAHLIAFGVFAVLVQLVVIGLATFRIRSEYTKGENSLIDINAIALGFLTLFFISDVRLFHEILNIPHFGVLGVLLFAYASLHDQIIVSKNFAFFCKIFETLIFSVFLTAAFLTLIPNFDRLFIAHALVFFMIVNLVIRIHFTAKEIRGENNFSKFVERVVAADKSSIVSFLREIKTFFKGADTRLLKENELSPYDLEKIHAFLDKRKTHLCSAFDLQNEMGNNESMSKDDLAAADQILDILGRFEMSHFCRISKNKSQFIIFNFFMIGQNNVVFAKTALISELSRLLEKN